MFCHCTSIVWGLAGVDTRLVKLPSSHRGHATDPVFTNRHVTAAQALMRLMRHLMGRLDALGDDWTGLRRNSQDGVPQREAVMIAFGHEESLTCPRHQSLNEWSIVPCVCAIGGLTDITTVVRRT
jgi:hypothetical protein